MSALGHLQPLSIQLGDRLVSAKNGRSWYSRKSRESLIFVLALEFFESLAFDVLDIFVCDLKHGGYNFAIRRA